VAVGNVDAHVTAPAAASIEPGPAGGDHGHVDLPRDELAVARRGAGMCGVVDGGIVEGLWGYEAGPERRRGHLRLVRRAQRPAGVRRGGQAAGRSVHEHLTELAATQAVGEHGLVALDWHSGNRSVLVDHELSGVVVGHDAGDPPEDVYRALLEATAFGTRVIVEAFRDSGVPVEEFVVAGGLMKNPLLMQIYSDVLRLPLSVIASSQGPALGSAIHAAVAAGATPDVPTACQRRWAGRRAPSTRRTTRARRRTRLFAEYSLLHDWFARRHRRPMHRLAPDSAREAVPVTRDHRPAVPARVDALREEVRPAARRAGQLRPGGLDGRNVSARSRAPNCWSIKPSGVSYDYLSADT
jgi:L-ribulokinase